MSGGIVKALSDFSDSLEKKSLQLETLMNDMEAMKHGLKEEKPYSRQTVEPMTRLRKSSKELEVAKEKPDEQFIRDRLNDILGI